MTDNSMPDQTKPVLAEFAALRAEIVNRSTAQYTLVGITLVAASAIGGLALNSTNPVAALLIGPVCVSTGLLWLDHAHAIYQIGNYIRVRLWPFLNATLDSKEGRHDSTSKIPTYESFALERKQLWLERSVVVFPFASIFVLPSVISPCFVLIRAKDGGWICAAVAVNFVLALGLLAVWLRFLKRVLRSYPQPA